MAVIRWLMVALALGAAPATAQVADLRSTTQFRVCADPANAPMSTRDGSGFENKLAEAFGEWLGLPVAYTWFPSGMGFIAKTLRAGECDVVMGYAQGDELVQVQGIVRPGDISQDNTSPSSRVAEARIVYGGRGPVAQSNAMGWLSRFFNSGLTPF